MDILEDDVGVKFLGEVVSLDIDFTKELFVKIALRDVELMDLLL